MMEDIKAKQKQKLRPPRSAKGPAPKIQQPEWNFDVGDTASELVEEKQMQKIVEDSRPSTAKDRKKQPQ